jgi:hypothetical protein
MKQHVVVLLVLALASITVTSVFAAHHGKGRGAQQPAGCAAQSLADIPFVTLEGAVAGSSMPQAGSRQGPVTFTLVSGEQQTKVLLGPPHALKALGLTVADGDVVQLTGWKVTRNDAELLVPKTIVLKGKTFVLRQDNGMPSWAGQSRMQQGQCGMRQGAAEGQGQCGMRQEAAAGQGQCGMRGQQGCAMQQQENCREACKAQCTCTDGCKGACADDCQCPCKDGKCREACKDQCTCADGCKGACQDDCQCPCKDGECCKDGACAKGCCQDGKCEQACCTAGEGKACGTGGCCAQQEAADAK